jgi:hypothetical protein
MFSHHFSATCICFGYHSSQAARRKKMEGNNSQVTGIRDYSSTSKRPKPKRPRQARAFFPVWCVHDAFIALDGVLALPLLGAAWTRPPYAGRQIGCARCDVSPSERGITECRDLETRSAKKNNGVQGSLSVKSKHGGHRTPALWPTPCGSAFDLCPGKQGCYQVECYAVIRSVSVEFYREFHYIKYTDVTKKENVRVSCEVRRVSSP